MGTHLIRMPDIGEGIAEAELVEWEVALGDMVYEDDTLATVMTDKATVDIPSPVTGKVTWLGGDLGALIAVGADLIRLEVEGEGNTSHGVPVVEEAPTAKPEQVSQPEPTAQVTVPLVAAAPPPRPEIRAAPVAVGPLRAEGEKPLAAPSVRGRAREVGIDLRKLRGSHPAGRITHEDLDAYIAGGGGGGVDHVAKPLRDSSVSEVRVLGLRRKIAERMQLANRTIAHITIVEEIDVTDLENLRGKLNARSGRSKLTLLPFVMKAMVQVVREQPGLNAHYDDEAGVVRRFGGVHIGIATQTPGGLMVPVVHHAEALDIWESADELSRVTESAKAGTAAREELSGSTITITSLGALGAISTTPIINHPEVAIVGINRMATRPYWDGTAFVPRRMMNISCSFDHRVIDGWDAAIFIQSLKTLLETPALIFVEK